MTDDVVSKNIVTNLVHLTILEFMDYCADSAEEPMTEKNKLLLEVNKKICTRIKELPSAQPTLYGYDIEHLKLIANVLQKENLPPERVTDALMDIGRIVAIVRNEFEETLRKAVEQCRI